MRSPAIPFWWLSTEWLAYLMFPEPWTPTVPRRALCRARIANMTDRRSTDATIAQPLRGITCAICAAALREVPGDLSARQPSDGTGQHDRLRRRRAQALVSWFSKQGSGPHRKATKPETCRSGAGGAFGSPPSRRLKPLAHRSPSKLWNFGRLADLQLSSNEGALWMFYLCARSAGCFGRASLFVSTEQRS